MKKHTPLTYKQAYLLAFKLRMHESFKNVKASRDAFEYLNRCKSYKPAIYNQLREKVVSAEIGDNSEQITRGLYIDSSGNESKIIRADY